MTFKSHIDEIYKKAMGTLVYLNRVKDLFEARTHKTVVKSLALSLINYCLVVSDLPARLILIKSQSYKILQPGLL